MDTRSENLVRAARAVEALADYLDQDDPEIAVSDLLADLMHYCHIERIDFEVVCERAMTHYNEELPND